MVRLHLVDFIQQQRSNNYTDAQIKDFLTKNGYTSADVDEAFKYAKGTPVVQQPLPVQQVQQQPQQPRAAGGFYTPPQGPDAAKPVKKSSSPIGLYLIFLVIVLAFGGGFLYLNGIFGTPAVTMDEVLSAIGMGSAPAQAAAPQTPAVQQPVAPAVQPPVTQPQTPAVNETPAPQVNATPAPAPTPNITAAPSQPAAPKAPSAGQLTYKNTINGMTFNYPKTWNLSESSDKKTITLSMPANNNRYMKNDIKMHVSILLKSVSTLQSFTTWVYNQFGFSGMTGVSITIAGKDGYVLQKSSSSKVGTEVLTKKYQLLTSINDDKGYYIYYIALDSDYDSSISAFNDFVSSFSYI